MKTDIKILIKKKHNKQKKSEKKLNTEISETERHTERFDKAKNYGKTG